MFPHLPTKNYALNRRMRAYLNKRFWKAVCKDYLAKSVGRKKINTLFTSLRPWAVLETSGTVFPYTDRPRLVNNIYIFTCGMKISLTPYQCAINFNKFNCLN